MAGRSCVKPYQRAYCGSDRPPSCFCCCDAVALPSCTLRPAMPVLRTSQPMVRHHMLAVQPLGGRVSERSCLDSLYR